MKRRFQGIAQVLFLLFLTQALCPTNNAQSVTGRISGAVRDASKAAVTGATVTVTNEATQIARSATTDDEGFYIVTNLPPGNYAVAVERAGFKKFLTSGNALVADGRLTVDATLEAGAVSETVNVTAEAGETVNTTSGEIARVVDGEQNNLAEKEPAKLKQLAAAWDKWDAELQEPRWIPERGARNRRR